MSKIEEKINELVHLIADSQDEIINAGLSISLVVGDKGGDIRSAHIGGVTDYIAFTMHDLASLYDVHLKTATDEERCGVEEFANEMAKLFVNAYNDGVLESAPAFESVTHRGGGKPSKFKS